MTDTKDYTIVKLFIKVESDTQASKLRSKMEELGEVSTAAYTDAFMEVED